VLDNAPYLTFSIADKEEYSKKRRLYSNKTGNTITPK